MKITKNKYLAYFSIIVILLAILRCMFPNIAKERHFINSNQNKDINSTTDSDNDLTIFFNSRGQVIKSRIYSVPHFYEAFPDSQNVQLATAYKYGVKPVENRQDAEMRKNELVYIGACPYFHVDKLKNSIPYLIPRAAILLNDIGKTFYDSLQIKNIPLHQIIVTSVLRSQEDILKLRTYNGNATQNSCHLYGTTFDICYNRYKTIQDPDKKNRRKVQNDTLKWILSEVLNDLRKHKRCYIKYEVKQGCFHITTR